LPRISKSQLFLWQKSWKWNPTIIQIFRMYKVTWWWLATEVNYLQDKFLLNIVVLVHTVRLMYKWVERYLRSTQFNEFMYDCMGQRKYQTNESVNVHLHFVSL
jgi:hypothetical protein